MKVFVFQSARDPDVIAYTRDEQGAVLPPRLGPWQRRGGAAVPIAAGLSPDDPVLQAIRTVGYFLARTAVIGGSRTGPVSRTDEAAGSEGRGEGRAQ